MNKTQLAEYLGMSNEMVTSILRGDFDLRVSKMVEIAIVLGYAPEFHLTSLGDFLAKDALKRGSEE